MNKPLFMGIGVVVLLLIGAGAAWVFSNESSVGSSITSGQQATSTNELPQTGGNQGTTNPGTPTTGVAYRATLSGTQACLPHKNTTGPQTLECAIGMKTDSGDYYALDFTKLPDAQTKIMSGAHFTVSGTVTPVETLNSDQYQRYTMKGIFTPTDGLTIASADSNSAAIGQRIHTNGVYITPITVTSDSRCPTDVQCIQAGTVTITAKLEGDGGTQTVTMTVGSPVSFGSKHVTLMTVAPVKHSKTTLKPSDYRFTFSVTAGMGEATQ